MLLAEARATADKLRGEGEAQAIAHLRRGLFSRTPHFFAVWRTLQAYRDAFEAGASRLVLTPDNDFLRYLAGPAGPDGAT